MAATLPSTRSASIPTSPRTAVPTHADLQDQVDATLKRDVVIEHQGAGTVEGYSVMYGTEGVTRAFVAARLEDGRRAWGISEDRDLLQTMTQEEFCGRQVNLADHQATF